MFITKKNDATCKLNQQQYLLNTLQLNNPIIPNSLKVKQNSHQTTPSAKITNQSLIMTSTLSMNNTICFPCSTLVCVCYSILRATPVLTSFLQPAFTLARLSSKLLSGIWATYTNAYSSMPSNSTQKPLPTPSTTCAIKNTANYILISP